MVINWLRSWTKAHYLFPEYIKSLIRQFQGFLWGDTLIAGTMVVVATLLRPPLWLLVLYFVFVLLMAGYYAWRIDHTRLISRFSVTQLVKQPTETEAGSMTLYVQIIPECLTDAPVYECQGHLLRVCKRTLLSDEWQETGMNFPLFLGWDCYGINPFTLQPGIRRRLNVCWWHASSMFIIPAVEPLPSKHRTIFDSTGTFRFDIRLTARDCPPVDVAVTVNLDERVWDKPRVTLEQLTAVQSNP